jgi:hypothetical protein
VTQSLYLLCYYKSTNADTPEEREDDEDTAYVSIRQHTSAYVKNADTPEEREDDEDTADIVARLSASVSIRQHPSASVSIQHTEERERYEDTDSRYCRTPARQYLSFCTSKASKLSTFLKRSPTGEALRVRRACTFVPVKQVN